MASSVSRASGTTSGASTTGTPGLMIPPFSAAIAAIVSPRISV
jgi:hypothetical protein